MSFVIRGGKSLELSDTGLEVVENGQKGGTKGKVDPLGISKSSTSTFNTKKAISLSLSLSSPPTLAVPLSFLLLSPLFSNMFCSQKAVQQISRSSSLRPILLLTPPVSRPSQPSLSPRIPSPLVVLLYPLHFPPFHIVSFLFRVS